MVDWDRVEQLHEKGLSWEDIAADPKVGFKPDQSVTQAGPALRRLYYRRKSREERQGPSEAPSPRKALDTDKKWNLTRIGYLLVPLVAIWFLFAYLIPSPVGLLLTAIPYIAIILGVSVILLAIGLLRQSNRKRWNAVFRNTVVMGVVLGVVITGLISLTAVISGCPFLPSSALLTSVPGGQGWTQTPSSVSPWTSGGLPVFYFYGAQWCPYCSASSWAIYKALTEFQLNFHPSSGSTGIPGTYTSYSDGAPEPYPYTPNVVFANAAVSSQTIAFVVNEAQNVSDGTFPGTTNCIESAYVSAYSGSSIPFVALNGQYIHGGSTLINPAYFSSYEGTGAPAVLSSVLSESGTPWSYVSAQAYWITALLVKASGETVSSLASTYHGTDQWTTSFQAGVNADLSQLGYSG